MKIIYIKALNTYYLVNAPLDLDLTKMPFSFKDVMDNTKNYKDAIITKDPHNDETGRLVYDEQAGEWRWDVYNEERRRIRVTDKHGLTHFPWSNVEVIERIPLVNRMEK